MSTAVENSIDPLKHMLDLRDANVTTLREIHSNTLHSMAMNNKRKHRSGHREGKEEREANTPSPIQKPAVSRSGHVSNDQVHSIVAQQQKDKQKSPESTPNKRNPRTRLTSSGNRRVQRPYINSDEECDSDEECYARSVRERKPFEIMERADHIEMREKMDQARVNRLFFDRSRHTEWKERQAVHQALIESNIWDPPSPPSGFDIDDCEPFSETVYTRKHIPPSLTMAVDHAGVPIPAFRLVSPCIPYDQLISRRFYDQYKKGMIRDANYELHEEQQQQPEPEAELPQDGALVHEATDRKLPLWRRVADLFSPLEWCDEESSFFEELVRIHGPNFSEISRIICGSKALGQIQLYCRKVWGFDTSATITDVHRRNTCHLCFITQEPSAHRERSRSRRSSSSRAHNHPPILPLIVCGACERGYHAGCLNPPLLAVPKGSWYCSDECVTMSELNCQLCGAMGNDEKMLLCDTCNKGYHMFCLTPPMTDIPEGDWNCPKCECTDDDDGALIAAKLKSSSPLLLSPLPAERTNGHVLKSPSSISPSKCKHSSSKLVVGEHDVTPYPHPVLSAAARLASFAPSSPMSLSIFALKRLGNTCVQCIIDGGLLDGDAIVSKNAKRTADHALSSSPPLFRDFLQVDAQQEYNTEDELLRHFDVILAAVSLATHHVYSKALGIDAHQHPPEIIVDSTPSSSSCASPPAVVENEEFATPVRRSSRKRKLESPFVDDTRKKKRHSTGSISKELYNSASSSSSNELYSIPAAGPRSWIFCFNPLTKDVDTMMQPNVRVEWRVRQHADSIKRGDKVYIWICGKSAGICALATVIENPSLAPLPPPTSPAFVSRNPNRYYRTTLQINTPLSNYISKSLISHQPELVDLTILKSPVATNFRVTPEQEVALHELFLQHSQENGEKEEDEPLSSASSSISASGHVEQDPYAYKECYKCKSPNGAMLHCAGCRDWYHSACIDSARPTKTNQPWYCPECASLNSQACSVCNRAADNELLSCDNCDSLFHLQCIKPTMTHMPVSWLCAGCMLTPTELRNCKLVIGWRELRAECNRLLQMESEQVAEMHKKNILNFSRNRKQVLSRMRALSDQLRDSRQCVVAAANNRFQNWAKSLMQTSSCSSPSSSSSSSPFSL